MAHQGAGEYHFVSTRVGTAGECGVCDKLLVSCLCTGLRTELMYLLLVLSVPYLQPSTVLVRPPVTEVRRILK